MRIKIMKEEQIRSEIEGGEIRQLRKMERKCSEANNQTRYVSSWGFYLAPVVTVFEHISYIINCDSDVNCVWVFLTLLAWVRGVLGRTGKDKV